MANFFSQKHADWASASGRMHSVIHNSGALPTLRDVFGRKHIIAHFVLIFCRCTRVKVIRVEVTQNIVDAHTTGWMTSTRPVKLRDFRLQPRRSNPRSGTCFELSERKALCSWNLEVRLDASLILVVESWSSLESCCFWSGDPVVREETWHIRRELAIFFFLRSPKWFITVFECEKFDGVCSRSTSLKIITIFRYVKRRAILLSNTCGAIVKKKKRKEKKTVHSTDDNWSCMTDCTFSLLEI